MTTALANRGPDAGAIEKVLIQGDLSQLTEPQRVSYYQRVCDSVGLNPLTKPFEYLLLGDGQQKKLVLYATRSCTDQLRLLRAVSVEIVDRKLSHGVYVVTARAKTPEGRVDESTGAVALERENGEWKTAQSGKRFFAGDGTWVPLKGDALANALMKAETKAKRRVTLSICGLAMMDETEIETVPSAQRVAAEVVAPPAKAVDAPPAAAEPAPQPASGNPWDHPRWRKLYEQLVACAAASGDTPDNEAAALIEQGLQLGDDATPADFTDLQWKRAEGLVAGRLKKLTQQQVPA